MSALKPEPKGELKSPLRHGGDRFAEEGRAQVSHIGHIVHVVQGVEGIEAQRHGWTLVLGGGSQKEIALASPSWLSSRPVIWS